MFQRLRRWFKRPSNPAGNIYYARLKTPQGIFYKLGYTRKATLLDRMAYGGHGDEALIDREFIFAYRQDAWDVEQTLLEYFDKHRAFARYSNDPRMPLAGRGQSELFARDILGLDEDLYRQTEEMANGRAQTELAEQKDGCLYMLVGLILAPFTLGISLFFIFGGASAFFSRTPAGLPSNQRPRHPPELQKLLDSLTEKPAGRASAA